MQVYENTQDPIHVVHLHARSSGVQFGVASGVDQIIEYDDTPLGMINIQTRQVDGHVWTRTTRINSAEWQSDRSHMGRSGE